MTEPPETLPDLPGALIDALRRRDRATRLVPGEVNDAILARARAQFATREVEYLPAIRNYWLTAAAAAAVVIAVFAATTFRHEAAPPAARVAASADDVDGSGQVDVLDAFALARRNAQRADSAAQTRIEALLARIVSLSSAARDAQS
jgi:hypothetical protein